MRHRPLRPAPRTSPLPRRAEAPARPLRIAQVAPLFEAVPPKLYGGTERVVSYLTEALVAQGHHVTLFASGDSVTGARLVPVWPSSLRTDGSVVDPHAANTLLLERVAQSAHGFDVIHFHCDYMHFPLSRRLSVPTVTTLHGRLDLPELGPLYREFADMPLVSISDAQRAPLPWANWKATIHHGLPAGATACQPRTGSHLVVLGRISPEKGVDHAVEIARRAGMPLKIAAKVDKTDRDYFEAVIRPLIRPPDVEFLGEIGERDKSIFLGSAYALLFPIDWPEPFGLVMIEAMACGVPVVAFRRGSVPEVIEDGVSGFVVDGVDEAVQALRRVGSLSRAECRRAFERRFTADRMARDYAALYDALVREAHPEGPCEQPPTI